MKPKIKFKNLFATGLLLATVISALADVHYVDVNSTNATPPYTNWATAATNIQDAVDAAVTGDEIVVTNGTYATGGRALDSAMTRVVVPTPLALRSVNGPQFTAISGGGAARCVYLTNGASLSGFTLTNGYVVNIGGGAYGGTLNNCTLAGNSVYANFHASGGGAAFSTMNNCTLHDNFAICGDDGAFGGGAYVCTLNNCTLAGNSTDAHDHGSGGGAAFSMLNNCQLTGNEASATYRAYGGGVFQSTLYNCTLTGNKAISAEYDPYAAYGGGAYNSTLNNCTLTGNSIHAAWYSFFYYGGGGAFYGTLNNCIVYSNTAYIGNPYEDDCSCIVNHCWVWPLDPLFVDYADGNLRLQSSSPCINTGNNAYAPSGPDLDGNPRISGGTVDVGAYEFQSPVSQISYAWLQQYGLPINSSTDTADPDGDSVDNYHEWLAGTDPTNPLSSPAQLTITPTGVPLSGIVLTWSTNAVGFTLQSTTNLLSPAAWVSISGPVVINGQNTVTNPITGAQKFYRLIQ